MDLCKSLLIGIASSLVASIVWWLLFQLIDLSARQKLNHHYSKLRDIDMQFQKDLDYNDYDLAIITAHSVIAEIENVVLTIKPTTYLSRKKRFVYTLLNNLYNYYAVFLREYKGYDINNEKEICCTKSRNNNRFLSDKTETLRRTTVSIELLQELNNIKALSILLNDYHGVNAQNPEDKKTILNELIIPSAFVYNKGIAQQTLIRSRGLTQKEYFAIINKIKK